MGNLKKIHILDWLVIALFAVVLYITDYQNMKAIDYVFLISIAMWFLIFIVRTFFLPRGVSGGADETNPRIDSKGDKG